MDNLVSAGPRGPGPQARNRSPEQKGSWIDVVLTPSGRTFIDGHAVTLASRLCGLRRKPVAVEGVRVLAGNGCRFDHLADIYRVCKRYGISRVELVA